MRRQLMVGLVVGVFALAGACSKPTPSSPAAGAASPGSSASTAQPADGATPAAQPQDSTPPTMDASQGCGEPEPAAANADFEAQFVACLPRKAYDARAVTAPLDSVAAGIIAQCHVEITFANGRQPAPSGLSDDQEMQMARDAVTRYRACAERQ